MGRVLPHEERLLTARAAIAIARKRHRPSAPTEVEGSRRLKSEDWLLEGVEFELSADFSSPSGETISPENQNAHEIAIAAQPEEARRFIYGPLPSARPSGNF